MVRLAMVVLLAFATTASAEECVVLCDEMAKIDRRAAEAEHHFNASQRGMNRDFLQSMEMRRQTDELRRIGNELEDLNALERQRELTRRRF